MAKRIYPEPGQVWRSYGDSNRPVPFYEVKVTSVSLDVTAYIYMDNIRQHSSLSTSDFMRLYEYLGNHDNNIYMEVKIAIIENVLKRMREEF